MKQVIVLVAMIILGVGIAGFVMDFEETAGDIAEEATTKINTEFNITG